MISKKILLISAPIGAGHLKAAQALAKVFTSQNKNIEVLTCNVFDFFSPAIGKAVLKGYLKILEYFPQAYGKMYGLGNESGFVLKMRDYLSGYLAKRMFKFIKDTHPSLIICTHATPAGLVAHLKKKGVLKIPSAAIITDYVVHRLWVYPELDRYFVATEQLALYLEKHGIACEKIKITGIPTLPAFRENSIKADLLKKIGLLKDKPIALIMGGGAGILPVEEILAQLGKIGSHLQIIIVTGQNRTMHRKLASYILKQKSFLAVKLYAYVDNIHELMTVCDVLISKPGGMTVTEALVKETPLVIYRPIPGQEEANTRFLLESGSAFLVNSKWELAVLLEKILISEPYRLSEVKEKIKLIKKPQAAFEIAASLTETFLNCDGAT